MRFSAHFKHVLTVCFGAWNWNALIDFDGCSLNEAKNAFSPKRKQKWNGNYSKYNIGDVINDVTNLEILPTKWEKTGKMRILIRKKEIYGPVKKI